MVFESSYARTASAARKKSSFVLDCAETYYGLYSCRNKVALAEPMCPNSMALVI